MKTICKIVMFTILLLGLIGCDSIPTDDITTGDGFVTLDEERFLLKFESNGGSEIADVKASDIDLSFTKPIPLKEGYEFIDWYLDEELTEAFVMSTSILGEVTLYAKWQALDFLIVFEENGGSDVEDITSAYLSEITLPMDVTREGYTFLGWYQDMDLTQVFDQTTMPLDGVTLYAKWQPLDYTILFEENGGSEVSDMTAAYESTILLPTDLTKQGYAFDGWYMDMDLSESFDQTTMPLDGITLYAKWIPALVDVTVHYYTQDLSLDDFSLRETVVMEAYTESNFSPEGKSIPGFSYDGDHDLDISQGIVLADGSLILHLYYNRNINTVRFVTNATISVESIVGLYESPISAPSDPVRVGYTFLGWYEDEALTTAYVFTSIPAEDIYVYAKWQGMPSTIYFNPMNDSVIGELTANTGDSITLPVPVKEGYSFEGWYTSSDYKTEFTKDFMPAGGASLYGKWGINDYTMTYYTSGGTSIPSDVFQYQEAIVLPTQPIKEGFIFDGWFIDQDFTIAFNETTMPANDLDLYALWIDAGDPNSILAQINQAQGDLVEIEATIYALHGLGYFGFYVFDQTGSVYVEYDHTGLEIGDMVQITGYLAFDDQVPYIESITSVVETSVLNDQPIAKDITLSQVDDLTDANIYDVFNIQGMLFYENNQYYIIDYLSMSGIPIYYQSNGSDMIDTLNSRLGHLVSLKFTMIKDNGHYKAALIDMDVLPMSDQDKLDIIDDILGLYLSEKEFLPGTQLEVQLLNYFNLGYINDLSLNSLDEQYFDEVTNTFLSTDQEVTIPFTFNVTISDNSYSLTYDVLLKPIDLINVDGFLNGSVGSFYQIEVLVVSTNEELDLMVLKDDSGFLYAKNVGNLQVGDKAIFIVRKDLDGPMVYLDGDGDIVLYDLVSHENDLNLMPEFLDTSQVLDLDYNDISIYGSYVEVRGFILPNQEDYNFSFTLVTDDYALPIFAFGHSGFEDLMTHEYIEVIMRAFIYPKDDGSLGLYYEGKRLDIRIPDHTNQELLDSLDKSFFYQFSQKDFDSLEHFVMMPYHPILGGEITWVMDDLTASLYRPVDKRFGLTEEEVTLSFSITISVDGVSKTISFNPKLKPIPFTSFSQIRDVDSMGGVLVKGTIWYWHQDFIYLIDEQGQLMFVEVDGLPAYRGDEVILYGQINYYQDTSEKYIHIYDTDEALIRIVSRNNHLTLEPTLIEIEDVLLQDAYDRNVYTKYFELSGKLIKVDDFTMILETADGFIYLDPVDDYTYFELERYKNAFVTIRVYLSEYDSYYLFDDLVWQFRYLGMPGDLVKVEMTDTEQIDLIEDYILTNYQINFESDHYFDFGTVLELYPEASIVFTEIVDNADLIDFTDDYSMYIDEVFSEQVITINADITVGEQTRNFDFSFTVIPEVIPVITDIADLIVDDTNPKMIEGQVLSYVKISSDQFVFLLEDETDLVFVLVTYNQYYNNNDWDGYIGETLRFIGLLKSIDDQLIFIPDTMKVHTRYGSVTRVFEEETIYSLAVLNDNNQSILGGPVQIQGMIMVEDNGLREYYITDGHEKVRLYTSNYGYDNINQYEGFIVVVNGFVYGEDDHGNMSIMFNTYQYNNENSLLIYPYTDEEVVLMVKEYIEAQIDDSKTFLNEEDYYYIPTGPSALHDHYNIIIDKSFGSGSDYVLDYDYYIRVTAPSVDTELEITLTITVGEVTDSMTYKVMIDGYVLGSLSDLFTSNTNVDEVALQARVIYNGWSFHYFLIDDEVYYLDEYVDAWFDSGDEVVIIGKKVIIDGISDYTYDISVITKSYGQKPLLTVLDTSIENLYTNDYTLNLLHRHSNRIYGRVAYDDYANMYTLTHNGQMVYIRANEGYEYYDYLGDYINDYVYLNVLLPMEYYRNEYMIVDVFGESDVDFPQYEISDEVQMLKEKLSLIGDIEVYSGDRLDDYINLYYFNYSVYVSFALVNSADDIYFDPTSSYVFNFVDTETDINIRINIHDGDTVVDYLDIGVKIKPRVETDIIDILYGIDNEAYYLSGIIIALHTNDDGDYENMIVENQGERIIVEFSWSLEYMYKGEDLTLAIGDEVKIIGQRAYYDHYGFVPNIYEPSVVEVVSSNNPFTHTPISMTFEEMLALDYTDPTIYTQYIEISGTIDWNGSYYYPTYYLVDYSLFDDYNYEYYSIELFADTYTDFNTSMSPYDGQDVIIRGYLVGLRYIYDHCDWHLYVDDIEIIVE
ncbi:MAG: InlB B-repeat-containing protein [Candidatus Izemoplasmatales bacterium]